MITAAPLTFLLLLLLVASTAWAQDTSVSGRVTDREHGEGLPGANVAVEGTSLGASTDEEGRFVLPGVPLGRSTIRVTLVGYADAETTVVLFPGGHATLEIVLDEEHEELEEVVITGTRTVRSIADVPVRVEAIPQEEVEEKLLMTPANVAMLLNESTGMRVQTTSAASNTANLRIQGLSGRFTQLLTDGVPNFGGLSSGFSITQIPPLNLRQVEVMKGATSSLYGPDAIAGVVNFITKRPPAGRSETSLLANATTAGGYDGAYYNGVRISEDFGYTLFGTANAQQLYDANGNDGFADIAEYTRFSLSPRIFFGADEGTRFNAGAAYLEEEREGGVMAETWPAFGPPPYVESITSRRWDVFAAADMAFDGGRSAAVKLSGAQLVRDSEYGANPFNGRQQFFYADAQYVQPLGGAATLLLGAAFSYEHFDDRTPQVPQARSYLFRAPGLFTQAELTFSPSWSALAGARVDIHDPYGTYVTPRLSVRWAPSEAITMRLGGGTGFKAPTIFTEEAEEIGFRNVRPIDGPAPEKAASGSFDVNWSGLLSDDVSLTVNAALTVSRIEGLLVTDDDSLVSGGEVVFRNADGSALSRGGEVSVRLGMGHWKAYLGYTYVYATEEDAGLSMEIALNPRHSAGLVIMYEDHHAGFKAGFETYFTGTQRLERNPYRDVSPSYFISGIVAEKAFGIVRLFVNFENFYDTRQTRWDPIWAGGLDEENYRPVPVYAPLEGRVVNGGVRLVF